MAVARTWHGRGMDVAWPWHDCGMSVVWHHYFVWLGLTCLCDKWSCHSITQTQVSLVPRLHPLYPPGQSVQPEGWKKLQRSGRCRQHQWFGLRDSDDPGEQQGVDNRVCVPQWRQQHVRNYVQQCVWLRQDVPWAPEHLHELLVEMEWDRGHLSAAPRQQEPRVPGQQWLLRLWHEANFDWQWHLS